MRLAKPPKPPMRSGLLPEARHVVLPKGIATSGFPRVRETCRRIGIEFDPWQQDLNRCLLAKRVDGLYAADTVVLSIARQVGKTFDIGAVVFAECIAQPGTTVVWTAHRFKVARESFDELRGLAKQPKLAPHIDYEAITTAAGNERIPFRNGSRIVFAARERGAIRGFTKVRLLVLDEAQILTHSALADLAPTMNQAVNPLIILMGTPPKPTDPGEVFTDLRSEALAQFEEHGQSEGLLYVEISADPGSDPDDREAWRQANPSYPKRTPARALLRLRNLLSDDDFAREALGIWDSERSRSVIPAAAWDGLADRSKKPAPHVGKIALAIDTDPERLRTSIVAAGTRSDGLPMVELVENLPGVDWARDRIVDMVDANPIHVVVIDKRSAAASLIELLTAAKVPVHGVDAAAMTRACGQFYDAATETGRLRHLDQIELNEALKSAVTRPLGDAWAWDRKKPTADITPLTAATLALYGHTTGIGIAKAAGRGRVVALT